VDQIVHPPLRRPDTPVPVLAHRGRGTGAPDNTIEAFTAALRTGADGVELDVRRSADGRAVVHHDAEVAGLGPVHLLSRPALPSWIPTLAEALESCRGSIVDVEVKWSPAEPGSDAGGPLAGEVAEIVAACLGRPDGPGRAFVTSFWPAVLEAVLVARPELEVGLLVLPGVSAVSGLDQARRLGASILLPVASHAGAELVEAAHDAGVAVVPWAADSDAELLAARDAGVDAVITDWPQRALALWGRP
jgi:glycerophosphoryl diester phosphodiesterase